MKSVIVTIHSAILILTETAAIGVVILSIAWTPSLVICSFVWLESGPTIENLRNRIKPQNPQIDQNQINNRQIGSTTYDCRKLFTEEEEEEEEEQAGNRKSNKKQHNVPIYESVRKQQGTVLQIPHYMPWNEYLAPWERRKELSEHVTSGII